MYIQESDLPQGSPQWLDWRKLGIGGSTVYGLAAHARIFRGQISDELIQKVTPRKEIPAWVPTPLQIYREFFGLQRREIPAFQANRGHRLEPIARNLAAETLDVELEQVCVYPDERPICRVSLDGYNQEFGELIEVKAPLNPWEYCPEYVIWQTAYQAAVVRAAGFPVNNIYILEIGEDDTRELSVRNWDIEDKDKHRELGESLMDLAEFFYRAYLATAVAPPYTANEQVIIDEDEELMELATQWAELKAKEAALKTSLSDCKERIMGYANAHAGQQPGIVGYGLNVRFSEASMRTDYQAALRALVPDADLTPYQSPSNTSATIRYTPPRVEPA